MRVVDSFGMTLQLRPGHARFLFEFLAGQLESEHAITHKILLAVPPDHGGYRPHPDSRSALELARHIVLAEIWFLDAVIERRFGEFASDSQMGTCQDAAQWYAMNFARLVPLLETLSDSDLATPVPFFDLRCDPAVAYLGIALRHSVHHRGQLSAYLRPLGARVPAIYVESGDEPYPPADGRIAPHPPPAF